MRPDRPRLCADWKRGIIMEDVNTLLYSMFQSCESSSDINDNSNILPLQLHHIPSSDIRIPPALESQHISSSIIPSRVHLWVYCSNIFQQSSCFCHLSRATLRSNTSSRHQMLITHETVRKCCCKSITTISAPSITFVHLAIYFCPRWSNLAQYWPPEAALK